MHRVPRLAVVHCPQWPVVATCGAPGEALAVIRANRVVARSVAAGRAGVRVGQRRREAQARCPDLRVVAHDPVLDTRAFHPVADAVADLVPRLEITRPGVLTFATRGPSRYFGGDEALAERVATVVGKVLGSVVEATGRPGVGVADGRFAAAVAARCAVGSSAMPAPHPSMASNDRNGAVVVAPGESSSFLAPLPLRWLIDAGGVAGEQVDLFRRLGMVTLGDLAALDEAHVVARFGRSGIEAKRMAAGADDRPPGAEEPPEGMAVVQHFDEPIPHLDAVVFAGRVLAEQLVETLRHQGRVCTQLVITAETDHAERSERVWTLSSGFSIAALVERVRWQLDGWATQPDTGDGGAAGGSGPPSAGITQLRLEPTEVRADEGLQLGLWGGRTQADDWARRAATRLAGLVGDEHVVMAQHRGSRHPGEVDQWVPASLALVDAAELGVTRSGSRDTRAPWPGSLPTPSPSIVYLERREVEVRDRDGRLVAVSGRGAVSAAPAQLIECGGGGMGEITAWAGPWLLDERWWDPARHRRQARFQLLMADGRAFLSVLEHRRWWLIAEYS